MPQPNEQLGQLLSQLLEEIELQGIKPIVALALQRLTPERRRFFLVNIARQFFDTFVEPIDLPGPDRLIDPRARVAIEEMAERMTDELNKLVPQ